MVMYLCSRFCIFIKPILEDYVSYIEGGPHLLQSCFRVAQDNLPFITREIHLFFLKFGNYRCPKSAGIF